MDHRKLGSFDVSVVGLGCNNFGGRIDAAATQLVVDAALDAGITLFDTADIYGGTQSEVLLGKALGKRRDRIVLATKFGMNIGNAPAGGSAQYVKTACEASLRRLGTDRIDVYQLHKPDPATPIADTLGALDDLVRAGKIREIGCSNFSVDQLREAKRDARGARFVSVQNELSLLHRADVGSVIPECERESLAYLPFFPLASGLLSGKYRGDAGKSATGRLASGGLADRFRTPANVAIVDQLAAIAERAGHTLLELAFGWLLAMRPVASVIAGATTADQVRANVHAGGWRPDATVLAEVQRVLGGS